MMSDTPAISRTLGGADEFERRMRMNGQPAAGQDDPLAELARLVGQEDPFKGVFPQARTVEPRHVEPPQAHEPVAPPQPVADPFVEPRYDEDFAAFDHEFRGSFEASRDPVPAAPPQDLGLNFRPGRQAPSYPAVSLDGNRRIEQNPDVWAQGQDADQGLATVVPVAERERFAEPVAGSSRRTLIVLAAVVVLTGGGLAASFLARPSGMTASASASTAAPTIMAATGPSKVQAVDPAADADAASQSSTLLDKNNSDGTATAKVVNNVEQPVDLSQAVKPTNSPNDDVRPAAPPSPFPEPKKVRTVVVRPDGSIVTDPAAAPQPNPSLAPAMLGGDQDASLAFDPRTSLPIVGANTQSPSEAVPAASRAATSKAATSKSTARAVTTPKVAAPAADTPVDADAATASVASKAKPHVATKLADASATDDQNANTDAAPSGGAFAVQLGAPPSEQEAKSLSSRLTKKYADQLGQYRPSIHQATTGDKSVYRIRVVGLSQADAKALCSKLQSGGGACFVARN